MTLALLLAGKVTEGTQEEFKNPLNFAHGLWYIMLDFRMSFKHDALLICLQESGSDNEHEVYLGAPAWLKSAQHKASGQTA